MNGLVRGVNALLSVLFFIMSSETLLAQTEVIGTVGNHTSSTLTEGYVAINKDEDDTKVGRLTDFISGYFGKSIFGVVAAGSLVYVDNFAGAGEISPIVTLSAVFVSSSLAGYIWKQDAWLPVAVTAIALPAVHLVKKMYGFPDTLHPNTFESIGLLAAVTFGVTAVGALLGNLVPPPESQ